ncbi:MAG: CBS domain-containing protein [Ruminococcus sp.]|nr:CBS domain-containing protein [Ruminococcus sp.]MEE0675219.1 CBS domain-containing protein [Ruminococcus sp.]
MNIIMLLKPKETVKYIYEDSTLRQGLEKMRAHSYTALPVINKEGKYIGTVSEGDFLYYILDKQSNNMRANEKYKISDILRPDFNPAVKINVSMDEVLNRALNQNFVPVTDDFDTFIGIVTRQDIIKHFMKK